MTAEKSIGLHGVVPVRSDGSTDPTAGPIRVPSCRDLHRINLFYNTTSLCATLIQRTSQSNECSLSCSHKSTTWPHPYPGESNPHPHTLRFILILSSLPSITMSPKWYLLSKLCNHLIHPYCHTPLAFFSLLDIPKCSYSSCVPFHFIWLGYLLRISIDTRDVHIHVALFCGRAF